MNFERPWALLVLLPLAWLWWKGLQPLTQKGLGALRRKLIAGSQGLLFLTLACALAGLQWVRKHEQLAVFLAVDRSRSTEQVPDIAARLEVLVQGATRMMREGDTVAVLQVARSTELVTPLGPRPREGLKVPRVPSGRDGTNLASAIALSLAEAPADSNARLILLSDGDETEGDARELALAASAAGMPIDVLPLERLARPDVAAVRLRLPDHVPSGEPVDLSLVTRSTRATRTRIELLRDGEVLQRTERTLGAGEDLVDLQDTPRSPGLHRYEVRLVPLEAGSDEQLGNESTSAYLRVEGPGRALVVSTQPSAGTGSTVTQALQRAGLDVTVRAPDEAPSTLQDWGTYDLVVLSDTRARQLDSRSLPALRDAVRELGIGLWMLGSDASFGPGGYAGSPVEEVLPVELWLRRKKERNAVALVIVIDRSGSMGAGTRDGRSKLELANEGAGRAGALLSPYDQIAILHVDTEVSQTLPMRPANDPGAVIAAAHRASVGGGGILMDVSLQAAFQLLEQSTAAVKHLLVLADGSDAEQLSPCHALASAALRSHNITTSVVAIGTGSDVPELSRLATTGGGRFYLTEDAHSLPQIFTEDTITSARAAIREEQFVPTVVHAAEALEGVSWSTVPALDGYVLTELKPRAELLLEALEHDPLLARWQVGLGRSAVLTTDLDGRWSRAWLPWPGLSAMVGQMGQWLARSVDPGSVHANAVVARGKLQLEVDATLGSTAFATGLDLVAHVVGPGAQGTVTVPLEARGAGRYAAQIDAPMAGSYLVTIAGNDGHVLAATGAESSSGIELQPGTGNRALLLELAALTGGRTLDTLLGAFSARPQPKNSPVALQRALTWLALGLLLLQLAFRRLPALPSGFLQGQWAKVFTRLRGPKAVPTEEDSSESAALLARLRSRRKTQEPEPMPVSTSRSSFAPPPSSRLPVTSTESKLEPTADSLDALVAKRRKRSR